LCPNCREEYPVTEDDFEVIANEFGKEYFAKTGIEYNSEMEMSRHVGCSTCSGTGYRGRMGIHELMEGTPEIKLMIKQQASSEELFKRAMAQGMLTLKQDGILKVLKGASDMEEVRRVCIN
jgi:type II secretory ATPase GspE/PulE/Tfp pilus assembly ATPase PilB-like protein